jgi:hypothetical protein
LMSNDANRVSPTDSDRWDCASGVSMEDDESLCTISPGFPSESGRVTLLDSEIGAGVDVDGGGGEGEGTEGPSVGTDLSTSRPKTRRIRRRTVVANLFIVGFGEDGIGRGATVSSERSDARGVLLYVFQRVPPGPCCHCMFGCEVFTLPCPEQLFWCPEEGENRRLCHSRSTPSVNKTPGTNKVQPQIRTLTLSFVVQALFSLNRQHMPHRAEGDQRKFQPRIPRCLTAGSVL